MRSACWVRMGSPAFNAPHECVGPVRDLGCAASGCEAELSPPMHSLLRSRTACSSAE